MGQSQQQEPIVVHLEEGHSPIQSPRQLITVVILSFLVPILTIILLAKFVVAGFKPNAGADASDPAAIAARIAPVGGFELVDANAPKVLRGGEEVYNLACAACHAAGVAGAPKFGDANAWLAINAQGAELMIRHAIEGIRGMPARGGNPTLDDYEVAAAVIYMANASGGSFPMPEPPAAEGAAEPAATPAAQPAAAAPAPTPAPVVAAPAAEAPVVVAATVASAPAAQTIDGQRVYQQACTVCHAAGVAGAPKSGDAAAWAGRIDLGVDALTASVISGKGIMPPRGGAAQASDAELKAAVEYMLAQLK